MNIFILRFLTRVRSTGGATLLTLFALQGGVSAQEAELELTFSEALERALRSHRPLQAARFQQTAAEEGARVAAVERWPTLGLRMGGTYSDDPVAVFGTRLRQGRFTEADFALEALNDPDPLADLSARVQGEWRVLDPVRDAGVERARVLARVAGAETERRTEATVYRTRALWALAQGARARRAATDDAATASRATRDLVARRLQEGLLTERDLLRADAALAEAMAALARADAAAIDALERLGLHLAVGPDSLVVPVGPADDLDPAVRDGGSPSSRADVRARELVAEASRLETTAARRARLPRVALTAAAATHSSGDFEDRATNGSAGLELSLPLFTGGRIASSIDRADAAARAAELHHEEAVAEARLEAREARRAVDASEAALQSATAAAEAATEAARLTRLRLAEGLTTPGEALQADADAARTDALRITAHMNLDISRAALEFALGGLPTSYRGEAR